MQRLPHNHRLRHDTDLHGIISALVPQEPDLLCDSALKGLKQLVKRQGIGPARRQNVSHDLVDRSMKFLINFLQHGKNNDVLPPPLRHMGKHVSTPPGRSAFDLRRLSPEGRLIRDALGAILEELKDDDSESDYDYDW